MPRRRPELDYADTAEALVTRGVRVLMPWLLWMFVLPLAAGLLLGIGLATHHRLLLAWLLGASAVGMSWFVTRLSHARGLARAQQWLTMFAALGWVAAVVRWGYGGMGGLLWTGWAAGGVVLCLAWNIRHAVHEAGLQEVTVRQTKRPVIDWNYVLRVMASRVPAIRRAGESAGKVVPALASPWRGQPPPAIVSGRVVDEEPVDTEGAIRAARAIQANWRDFTTRKVPDLAGVQLRIIEPMPWRIRAEAVGVRGVHTPEMIIGRREHLASQNAMPLSHVIARTNPADHHRVYLDFVLEDVLAEVPHWPGPEAIGQSIAAAPVRYGVYEDRTFAESWETAVTAAMARRLGISARNLSHIISEGMTGSGKSTVVRIVIADGAARTDVEDWALDPVKKFQTLGCVAGALSWFAVDVPESKAMVRWLARAVIPARANYLGLNGYDEWEQDCGLPFLRVHVEEGGIIASELKDLPDVLNSARSAGVKVRGAFQRAQHKVLDPNVRAAFGESLSFGCKDADDAFCLPDELKRAGADPSQWKDRRPGQHYRAASGLDLRRQLMPVRGFRAEQRACTVVVEQYAAGRDERIRRDCPDWFVMLDRLDDGGLWENRTTGTAVQEQMRDAARRRGAPRLSLVTEDVPDAPPPRVSRPSRSEELGRDAAVERLRAIVAALGPGTRFTPADIYDDACAATGRAQSWVRGELLTTLAVDGTVRHDKLTGTYTVTDRRDGTSP